MCLLPGIVTGRDRARGRLRRARLGVVCVGGVVAGVMWRVLPGWRGGMRSRAGLRWHNTEGGVCHKFGKLSWGGWGFA